MSTRGELYKKYMEAHPEGKRPSPRWNDEEIKAKIKEFEGETEETDDEEEKFDAVKLSDCEDYEEYKRMKEAYIINNRMIRTVFQIEPIFLKGKPYAIMDNEYVPWEKAELIVLNNKKKALEEEIKQKQRELTFNPK